MDEYLDAYNKKGHLVKTANKQTLLSEIKEYSLRTGDANLAVPAVFLILTHPQNGLYVIKRANKEENPHQWCKTVGGHIISGEDPENALRREANEEINIDLVIATSPKEYRIFLQEYDSTEKAVVRELGLRDWFGTYRIDRETGRPWKKRFKAYIYAGQLIRDELKFTEATDPNHFSDGLGEAVELKFIHKKRLKRFLEEGDRRFTHDLQVLVQDYYVDL